MNALWIKVVSGVALAGLALFLVGRKPKDDAPKDAKPAARTQLKLSPEILAKNKISATPLKKIPLQRDLELVGSATYDADHYALVGPLIAGRVISLKVGVGDEVKKGQVLAELESPEVGAAAADYLTAKAKYAAAQTNVQRERDLSAQRVSSERDRELAEAQAASEKASLAAAVQRLESLGMHAGDLGRLTGEGSVGGRLAIRAPIGGTVISREVTLGEAIAAAADAFKIANLTRLWVNLDVYEKDLSDVRVHQKVAIRTEAFPGRVFDGKVAYIEPSVDEKTRTSRVRIEIDNKDRSLRPGQFVTAKLASEKTASARMTLAVPKSAVLTIEGKPTIFIQVADGVFEKQVVELGVSGSSEVEILRGAEEGQQVVVEGMFLLKSELLR